MAKYPNVKIERTKKSFEDLLKTVKLAVSGDDAPDVVQANQGRADHGRDGQGRAAAPGHRLREGLRLGGSLLPAAAGPQQVLLRRQGVRLRRPVRALADAARSSASTTTRTRSPTPPTTLDEFEASLQEAKDAGETPIMFGNLEKWPGIHNFETRARADRRQAGRSATSCSPRTGASFDNPEFQAGGRRRSRTGSTRATSTRTSTARTTTRRGRTFAKGKSRYLIAGTWVTADLAEQMGDNVGFMLMPGQDPNAPGLARRRGPAVDDHRRGQEPRRGGGLHRLPHRRERGQGARRHGQPARR